MICLALGWVMKGQYVTRMSLEVGKIELWSCWLISWPVRIPVLQAQAVTVWTPRANIWRLVGGWPEQLVMKVAKVGDVREATIHWRLGSSNLQVYRLRLYRFDPRLLRLTFPKRSEPLRRRSCQRRRLDVWKRKSRGQNVAPGVRGLCQW